MKHIVIAIAEETPESDYAGILDELGMQIYEAGTLIDLDRNSYAPIKIIDDDKPILNRVVAEWTRPDDAV